MSCLSKYLSGSRGKSTLGLSSTTSRMLIDCGAGTGLCGVELHKLGYTHLCALDISPEMLNEARKKNVYQKFICAPLNSDQNPEVITGEYDAMICIGTLAAAHVKPTALVEMIRMIKIVEILNCSFLLKFAGERDYYHNQGESKNQRFASLFSLHLHQKSKLVTKQ